MDIQSRDEVYAAAVTLLRSDDHEVYLHPHYGGHSRYGQVTPGIIAPSGVLVGWAIATVVEQEVREILGIKDLSTVTRYLLPQRREALGRGAMIFY